MIRKKHIFARKMEMTSQWLLDISKYVVTSVVITSILKGIDSQIIILMIGVLFAVFTFLLALMFIDY